MYKLWSELNGVVSVITGEVCGQVAMFADGWVSGDKRMTHAMAVVMLSAT